MKNPFRYFKTSPEIIRLAVMMYVRFPLSLRQVEDLLHELGIDVSYETVRAWCVVESVRTIVCRENQEETIRIEAGLAAMALAFGRSIRSYQW